MKDFFKIIGGTILFLFMGYMALRMFVFQVNGSPIVMLGKWIFG